MKTVYEVIDTDGEDSNCYLSVQQLIEAVAAIFSDDLIPEREIELRARNVSDEEWEQIKNAPVE